MNPAKRLFEFPYHLTKRQCERRPPPDQYVIMAGAQRAPGLKPDDLPQATPHPVTLNGIADLLRHREADTHGALVPAPASLQHERIG